VVETSYALLFREKNALLGNLKVQVIYYQSLITNKLRTLGHYSVWGSKGPARPLGGASPLLLPTLPPEAAREKRPEELQRLSEKKFGHYHKV
jgi:hypothetical protein